MEKVLTICIPTFNRASIVAEDVEHYLSIHDDRFEVKVCDNCSSDSTYEILSQINDERFFLVKNEENIGGIPNMIKSLSDNRSKYSLLLLDKDLLDKNYIVRFIDFLENKDIACGFINPDLRLFNPNTEPTERIFSPGIDSVLKMAYLNQHPTGYFFNSRLFDKVRKDVIFNKLDKNFVFPFEVINAPLSLKYNSAELRWPAIIRARMRGENHISFTYNNENIWYSFNKRKECYIVYLNSLKELQLSPNEYNQISYFITQRTLSDVSTRLKSFMRSEYECSHYNVTPQELGYFEMIRNCISILKIYKEYAKSSICQMRIYRNIINLFVRRLISITSFQIKNNGK